MNIRYIVELDEEERMQLQELTSAGKARVRRVKRAQILLGAEQGHGDAMIAATVGVVEPAFRYLLGLPLSEAEFCTRNRCWSPLLGPFLDVLRASGAALFVVLPSLGLVVGPAPRRQPLRVRGHPRLRAA